MPDERVWAKFKIGNPPTARGWCDPDCRPFEEVSHIAHVSDALRILEDGVIRSSLVWDESKLRTKRTCVSWVSPNSWSKGSLYGNVEFAFDWKTLVSNKQLYWVEDRATRRQTIIRLLFSGEAFTDEPLEVYDPSRGDGPLWYDNTSGNWYYNGSLTNEYMVLADLNLDSSCRISFCNHHPTLCSKFKSGPTCPDLDRSSASAAATFLARMIGANHKDRVGLLSRKDDPKKLSAGVEGALFELCTRLERKISTTPPSAKSDAFPSLVRSMCLAYSMGQTTVVEQLGALFSDPKIFREAYTAEVENFFGGINIEDLHG